MHKTWLKRIERLEVMARLRAPKHAVFRYGYVHRLATDSNAERHVAITATELTELANVEHCEFEERMGPQPGPIPDLSFTVYLKMAETPDSAPSP
jgi:hypothetical protein